MVRGTLSLYSKEGIFLQEFYLDQPAGSVGPGVIDGASPGKEGLTVLPCPVLHPVEVPVSGDYLTGSFRDARNGTTPYRIRLWLLVEEEPETIEEDPTAR